MSKLPLVPWAWYERIKVTCGGLADALQNHHSSWSNGTVASSDVFSLNREPRSSPGVEMLSIIGTRSRVTTYTESTRASSSFIPGTLQKILQTGPGNSFVLLGNKLSTTLASTLMSLGYEEADRNSSKYIYAW